MPLDFPYVAWEKGTNQFITFVDTGTTVLLDFRHPSHPYLKQTANLTMMFFTHMHNRKRIARDRIPMVYWS